MRTTLTIDDDLLREIREVALRDGVPVKQVLNRVLRKGIEDLRHPRKQKRRYRLPTFALGHPVQSAIDLDKALAIATAIDDQALVGRLDFGSSRS